MHRSSHILSVCQTHTHTLTHLRIACLLVRGGKFRHEPIYQGEKVSHYILVIKILSQHPGRCRALFTAHEWLHSWVFMGNKGWSPSLPFIPPSTPLLWAESRLGLLHPADRQRAHQVVVVTQTNLLKSASRTTIYLSCSCRILCDS